jgi:hypothetical protein
MNTLNRDYDDVLRRALHAAAESIEPAPDGLERIRARLGTPPLLSFASAVAWSSEAATRIVAWAAPIIRSALDAFWSVIDRFRPAEVEPGQPGPRFGWLRPMVAMGTAIFVVAAGAFAIMTLPRAISSSGSAFTIFPWTHPTSSSGNAGASGLNGGATQLPGPGVTAPGPPGVLPVTSPASSACSALGNSRTGSATPTPTISVSTSPSASSSSPSTSGSPSVTPSTTTTPPASSPPTSVSTTPDPGAASTPSPSTSAVTGGGITSVSTGGATPKAAVLVPTSSASATATPKSPCPPGLGKKKKKKSETPLALGGLAAQKVTMSGVKD